jgi:hypothetical protein
MQWGFPGVRHASLYVPPGNVCLKVMNHGAKG